MENQLNKIGGEFNFVIIIGLELILLTTSRGKFYLLRTACRGNGFTYCIEANTFITYCIEANSFTS